MLCCRSVMLLSLLSSIMLLRFYFRVNGKCLANGLRNTAAGRIELRNITQFHFFMSCLWKIMLHRQKPIFDSVHIYSKWR